MEEGFRAFLKKQRRSSNTIRRAIRYVKDFEAYLREHRRKDLGTADVEDLEGFVEWIEIETNESANVYLWGLGYYFAYAEKERMRKAAGALRRGKIKRKPFLLREFRGVSESTAEGLARVGVEDVEQMLRAGRSQTDREALSQRSGLPLETVLELVKLSDLARIPGLKSIRARLYYDAGMDTLEKIAQADPEEMREMLVKYVERTGFDGMAPWPAEAESAVSHAKKLPSMVEY